MNGSEFWLIHHEQLQSGKRITFDERRVELLLAGEQRLCQRGFYSLVQELKTLKAFIFSAAARLRNLVQSHPILFFLQTFFR